MSEDNVPGTEHKTRYYPRMSVEVLLSYRPDASPKTDAVIARTKTLGLGGFMFESDSDLEEGVLYHVELVFGEEKVPLRARVVYSLPSSEGTYEVGFAFEDLSDGQREELTGFFIQEYEKLPPENL